MNEIKNNLPTTPPPLNTEVLIFAPDMANYWIKAKKTFTKQFRKARWQLLEFQGRKASYPHRDFEPLYWLPIEPKE